MMNDVRFLGGHGTNGLDGKRREPVQQRALGRPRPRAALGQPVPEPVGDRRRRRHVLRHLDPEHLRAGGPAASRTPRPAGASTRSRASTTCATRYSSTASPTGSSTRCRPRPSGARAASLCSSRSVNSRAHHALEPPHLPGDQQRPAVPVRDPLTGSRDIRFRNVHCYSNSKVAYDATVCDHAARPRAAPARVRLARRRRAAPAPPAPPAASRVLEPGAASSGWPSGFHNISGGAAGPERRLLFRRRALAADPPLVGRASGAHDRVGRAAPAREPRLRHGRQPARGVVRRQRHAVSRSPTEPKTRLPTLVAPQPAAARPGATAILPVGDWRLQRDAERRSAAADPPVPFPRRPKLRLGDAGLRRRRDELGREEQRPRARLRPAARAARRARLPDERSRDRDLVGARGRRRQPERPHAFRRPGRRRRGGGRRRQRLSGGRRRARVRPIRNADRDDPRPERARRRWCSADPTAARCSCPRATTLFAVRTRVPGRKD